MAEHIRVVGLNAKSHWIWTPANEDPGQSFKQFETQALLSFPA